jgi:hypothetical protein
MGRELDKPWFPNTPVGTFGRWGGATQSRRPLGLAAGGAWLGAGEPLTAPTASAAAAFFVVASSTGRFAATFSMTPLSAASLSAAVASSHTTDPTLESCRSRFCRGSSSSDDTSSSSRMTRVYLPLPRVTAPPRPPTEVPLRLPAGLPPAETPPCP